VSEYGVPVSRACKMMRLSRSGYYYKSKKDDSEVIEALRERAEQKPAHGFRKMYSYLRRKGRA
jgi:putative transposase